MSRFERSHQQATTAHTERVPVMYADKPTVTTSPRQLGAGAGRQCSLTDRDRSCTAATAECRSATVGDCEDRAATSTAAELDRSRKGDTTEEITKKIAMINPQPSCTSVAVANVTLSQRHEGSMVFGCGKLCDTGRGLQ